MTARLGGQEGTAWTAGDSGQERREQTAELPPPPPGPPPRPGRCRRLWRRSWPWVSYPLRLGDDRPATLRQAFDERPFGRLALANLLSIAGDTLVTVALAGSLFFSISLKAARGRVALSLLFTIAPFAIVAPFLGPAIERIRGGRRAMAALSAAVRAVAAILMAAWVHSLLIFVAALLSLVFSKAYGVSKASLVPAAVQRREQLVEANSKLSIGGVVVGILAAGPAAAIFKLFGSAALLRVDAVVFVACAVASMRLRGEQRQVGPEEAAVPGTGPSAPGAAAREPSGAAASGANEGLWHGPEAAAVGSESGGTAAPPPGALQLAAVAMGSLRALVGLMTFLVAFSFRDSGAPAYWYGLVLLAGYAGNVGGATIAPFLRDRLAEERIVVGAVAAVSVTAPLVLLWSTLHRWPAALILALVVGLAAGGAKLAFDSLVQRDVPLARQGRLFARFEAGFQVVWVLGALLPVIVATPLAAGFVVVAVVSALALVAYLWGIHLAHHGSLPSWFPYERDRAAGAARNDVLGGPVG